MRLAATTTAFGDADHLDDALQRIAAIDDVDIIELSIGARPIPGGPEIIAEAGRRWTMIAHHTAPIGDGRSIRPSLDTSPHHAVAALTAAGIRRYSGHPPPRKHADHKTFTRWALDWFHTLADAGIDWAVETMYRPQVRNELATTGGHHLSTPSEVWDFCDLAERHGWTQPLLIDASHLHIGWTAGDWTDNDIVELLTHAPCAEIHVSSNDGVRDEHRPLDRTSAVASWVLPHLDRFEIVVDEGRRRGDYELGHFAATTR